MSILAAILGFNLLVVVHELGHYLLARACKMRVLRFSIGFGPAILTLKGKQTELRLGLLPLGGYVQVAGLGGQGEDHAPGSYQRAPLLHRALMVAAGPVFNLVFAAVLFGWLFGSFNALTFDMRRDPTTVVREVSGPAAAAGLQPFDTIVEMSGQPVRTFRDIQRITGESRGQPMQMVVVRPPPGERPAFERREAEVLRPGIWMARPAPDPAWARVTLTVVPEATERGLRLGLAPDLARFGTPSAVAAVGFGMSETWSVTRAIVVGIGNILTGREKAEVASVVKITEMGADSVRMGFGDWFLNLMALLSINLALLNLLPLPALDGGRLVFIGIEAIARRPVPRRVENLIHGLGMIVLLGLILLVTGLDIASYF